MNKYPRQLATLLHPPFGWRWRLFGVFSAGLIVPGRVDDHPRQSTPPLTPPSGRHWKIYAICGPVLIVSGIVLRFLGDAGTGNFLVVIGATMLAGHLYMRPRALYVHDVCREVGYCNF